MLLSSKHPLPAMAGEEEILSTEKHTLPTFYPISPNIDLQLTNVYELLNDTGGSFHQLFGTGSVTEFL